MPETPSRRSGAAPVLTPERYLARRRIVAALGLTAALPALAWAGLRRRGSADEGVAEDPLPWLPDWAPAGGAELYPALRNASYDAGRPLTPERAAGSKNNFYEFLPGGAGEVWPRAKDFHPRPWMVSIAGEVEQEREVDLDDVAQAAPLEEREYRFRCVERWSMTVPWTGLPLAAFVKWCKPLATAKYVRFVSFEDAAVAPGQKKKNYPWPYYEGLSIEEATNPLALLVTGIYGHGLPAQHGAPLRVIVPWKYGYKSPKSIVRVEFTREQPHTFWSDLNPKEYPFESNVDPARPHPRWSQAIEWDLATEEKRPTQPFNGYGEQVAKLYRPGR